MSLVPKTVALGFLKFIMIALILVSVYFGTTPTIGVLGFLISWPLSLVLGKRLKGSEDKKCETVRMEIAQLYLDSQTEKDPSGQALAFAIQKSGLSKLEIKNVLEVEVGPIMAPMLYANAFAMGDAYEDPINAAWLSNEISRRIRAFNLIRRIPLIGFFWTRSNTALVKNSVQTACREAFIENEILAE